MGPVVLLIVLLLLSLHLTVPTAIVALLVMGAAVACFSATQYALVHVSTPPEHRGRATGVLSFFIGSSMLGHYIAGQLFGNFASTDAMRIIGVGGLVAMAILGAIWVTMPRGTAEAAKAAARY
jgi:MFS family permease